MEEVAEGHAMTLQRRGVVTADHKLTVEVPPEVLPGEHRIVLQIDDQGGSEPMRPLLDYPSYPLGIVDERLTFRRDDIYGPDGR